MADHTPTGPVEMGAEMDYAEHDKTYHRFLTLAKYVSLGCVALLAAMAFGFFTTAGFFSATVLFMLICGAGYLLLQHAYTTVLKRIVILDVIVVAIGFIVRAYMGGMAIDVDVSPWLVLVTFLLALFLALARRKQELVTLGDAAGAHRKALADYTPALLDQLISPTLAATLVAYMVYSVSPEVSGRLGTSYFHLTVPCVGVVFGMFRYLYLVHRRGEGEDPARVLLADAPLRTSVVLWAVLVVGLIYGPTSHAALGA